VLFHDELVVIAHPSHPLAARPALTLEETLAYPWVAPPKDTPAGAYLFDELRIGERERTPVRVVSSSLALLRGILARGPYLSIISRHQIAVEVADGHVAPLPIPLKAPHRPIGLTFRVGWRPTATQAQFIDYLRRFSASGATDGANPTEGI
jgi:DNA-binding transcriptional LysR family regulator